MVKEPEWRPLVWRAGIEYARLDECDPKMQQLLIAYGTMFDDIYNYKLVGKKRYVHRHKHTWLPRKYYEKKHRY